MSSRFFACLTLVAAAATARGGAQQPQPVALFIEVPAGAGAGAVADAFARPGTVQARTVGADLGALAAPRLDIALTPERHVTAELVQRSRNRDGSESWAGQIAGEPLSAATFVRMNGILQGSIRTLDAAYSIEPAGSSGLHVVKEVDLQALGDELPPAVPEAAAGGLRGAAESTPRTAGDDGTVFDVLVVYTAAARDEAGGDSAMQARINLGISETNTAYANSGVIPRLRLVGAELIAYSESGDMSLDLSRITTPGDGQMDGVHARRNTLGADLVKLVVANNVNYCGIAWLMTADNSANFGGNAFSVTSYPCISPNYTFGHELGHNMGSNHAPQDGTTDNPLYAYSYGYKYTGPSPFRTVMAYDCPSSCPRLLYFSNPAVLYGGQPTGTVAANNNALSINNARTIIANWRQSAGGNTAPSITSVSNRTTPEDTATSSIPFTVGDAETGAGSLVVSASSSNTAVVANTTAGLTLGGSGSSRTLVVTPQPDASGAATITLTVSDGSLTASTSFTVTVTSVNDAPVVSAISPRTTGENQPIAVPFTVSDAETSAASLLVQASSSNPAIVASSGIVLGGSGGSRVVTLTPVTNAVGETTITLSVSDGSLTTPRTFVLTVNNVDDAPVFVALPPLVSTTVGAPASVTVTIADEDSAPAALSLTVASANAVLLPPGGITVTPMGSSATSRTFQVGLTPSSGQSGTSALTFTAGDGSSTTVAQVAFSVTTSVGAPDPPTSGTATATGTSVRFAWTPALTGTAPTSFSIEIGTAAGTTTLPVQSVPWPTINLTVVLPAGTYYARVRAVNGSGTSTPSPEITVAVVESSPIPGPPSNFWARTSGRNVSFSWAASVAGDPATSYTIEAGSAPGLGNLARLDTGSNRTAFDVANVPVGTYWVRVRGSNAAGVGAPSQDVAIVMGNSSGCVGLPGPPVLLTPVVGGLNVNLTWNAPALGSAATGYVLYAGSSSGLSNLAAFGTGSSATSFAASAPAGLYYVRVAASNSCGVGPVSNEVSFTLGVDLPHAPSGLDYSVSPSGLVTLTWIAAVSGGSPTAYLVEAGSASGLANLAFVSTGSTATVFTAQAPPGTYYVRVRAVNASGPGTPSNEVIVEVP